MSHLRSSPAPPPHRPRVVRQGQQAAMQQPPPNATCGQRRRRQPMRCRGRASPPASCSCPMVTSSWSLTAGAAAGIGRGGPARAPRQRWSRRLRASAVLQSTPPAAWLGRRWWPAVYWQPEGSLLCHTQAGRWSSWPPAPSCGSSKCWLAHRLLCGQGPCHPELLEPLLAVCLFLAPFSLLHLPCLCSTSLSVACPLADVGCRIDEPSNVILYLAPPSCRLLIEYVTHTAPSAPPVEPT